MRPSLSPCAFAALCLTLSFPARAFQTPSVETFKKSLHELRQLPEAQRGARDAELAHQIAALPASLDKVRLANSLAQLSTEGDPGRDNLQAVTDALAQSLAETAVPGTDGKIPLPFHELAVLERYEGMHVSGPVLEDPQYKAAADELAAQDEQASHLDFTLKDIHGKKWTKSQLQGKVVLLNFWATWCPPCRQELPNLDAIAAHYAPQGLVVLAVTNEDAAKVNTMFHGITPHFNILLDDGNKVGKSFRVESLPRTLVFNREGKLAATAMDARTQKQILLMLKSAGLQL